jgi:VWFA-related protein
MLCCSVVLQAQTPESYDSQITFKAVSELVVLPVNVTSSHGDFVTRLTSTNFRVYENGRPQKIKLFQQEGLPVTVGLILDHSQSMAPKLSTVRAAVLSFAASSNREDEMFVVDFSDRVRSEIFRGKLFTSNVSELQSALAVVGAQGETALYDAIYEGLDRLRVAHRDKKALIIVSDGEDNVSRHRYHEVVAKAHESQAVIYAIGLISAAGEEENPRILERLCKDTGGLAFFPHNVEMVREISNRIADDLRQQYTLGYIPDRKASGSGLRKVEVKVSAPGYKNLHVRTRLGYSIPEVGTK